MSFYPSWVAGLKYRSPDGLDRARFAYLHLHKGSPLELEQEPDNPEDPEAVAYRFDGHHLGYVPRKHHWVSRAIDEGHDLCAFVFEVETGGWFRRKAKRLETRIGVVDFTSVPLWEHDDPPVRRGRSIVQRLWPKIAIAGAFLVAISIINAVMVPSQVIAPSQVRSPLPLEDAPITASTPLPPMSMPVPFAPPTSAPALTKEKSIEKPSNKGAMKPDANDLNEANRRLMVLGEDDRRRALFVLLSMSNERCAEVTRTFYKGSVKPSWNAIWNVECRGGPSYSIQVRSDEKGSSRITTCGELRAVSGGECFRRD